MSKATQKRFTTLTYVEPTLNEPLRFRRLYKEADSKKSQNVLPTDSSILYQKN